MGVDLSKIGFQRDTNARKSKFDPGLLAEYDAVRKQLIESGADLSKIKIVEAH